MASKRLVLFFCLLSLLVTTMAARELAETAKEERKETAAVKPDGYDTQDSHGGIFGGHGNGVYCVGGCHYGGFGGCYRCCYYSGCWCCATAEEAARVNALGKPQN